MVAACPVTRFEIDDLVRGSSIGIDDLAAMGLEEVIGGDAHRLRAPGDIGDPCRRWKPAVGFLQGRPDSTEIILCRQRLHVAP